MAPHHRPIIHHEPMKKTVATIVAAVLLAGAGVALIAGQTIVAGILVICAAVGLVVRGR